MATIKCPAPEISKQMLYIHGSATLFTARPMSQERQPHTFHRPHNMQNYELKSEGGGQGRQKFQLVRTPDTSRQGLPVHTPAAGQVTMGAPPNLNSPPDHNEASAKEKVLRYLSNNVPPEAPDFELDNYQNGQYNMDAPLGHGVGCVFSTQ